MELHFFKANTILVHTFSSLAWMKP